MSIPAPPPLALKPTYSRALVTVAVGPEGERLLAASGPSMRRYAESVGADFVVLVDYAGPVEWPMGAKFGIARVLDYYEQIAYVDADVLLRPGAVNLFGMCGSAELGICDELPYHRRRGRPLERVYTYWRLRMGLSTLPSPLPWYVNAGVMVVPRTHRDVIAPPSSLWVADHGPNRHCAEQHLLNTRLLASGVPFRILDRRANWQFWTDRGFRRAPPDAVLHWAGARRASCDRAAEIATLASGSVWL